MPKDYTPIKAHRFQPVFAGDHCAGFLLRNARGCEALDVDGKSIGAFASDRAAVARLRELAAEASPTSTAA